MDYSKTVLEPSPPAAPLDLHIDIGSTIFLKHEAGNHKTPYVK